MLLPLTSAVYVPGKLASHDSILLDIGTGYFAEVSYIQVRQLASILSDAISPFWPTACSERHLKALTIANGRSTC